MNIEHIFRQTKLFENIKIDFILVESKYPILFTCRDENDIYLFICCLVNSKTAKWLGTKTNYETLISLLKNEITIRDAFLGVYEEKVVIEHHGNKVFYEKVMKKKIPDMLLPTKGEYMEAEDGEFDVELSAFNSRITTKEVVIKPQINSFLFINLRNQKISLSDDYFIRTEESNDGILLTGIPDYKMNVTYGS